MKKYIMVLLLITFMVITFAKNITLVYDDSGSMKENQKWVYANYSVQVMIGLMNKNDSLFIVKMSDFVEKNKQMIFSGKNESLKANLNNQNKEMDFIRMNINYASQKTPYVSVIKSMEVLENYINPEKQEENWLIIITDGNFEDGASFGEKNNVYYKTKIVNFIKNTSSKPVFLIIGNTAKEIEKYTSQEGIKIWKDIYSAKSETWPKIYTASSTQEILLKMRNICNLTASRSNNQDDFKYTKKDNKILLYSRYALNGLKFFEQTDKDYSILASIKSAISGDKNLKLDETLKPRIKSDNLNLNGKITPVLPEKDVIPQGNIVIEFDKNIEKAGIEVLPEYGFTVSLALKDMKTGKNIEPENITPGQEAEISMAAKDSNGNGIPLDPASTAKVQIGGKTYDMKYDPKTGNYVLPHKFEDGDNRLTGSINSVGYNSETQPVNITNIVSNKEDLTTKTASNTNYKPVNVELIIENTEIKRTEIDKLKVRITPLIDKKYVTPEQYNNMEIKAKTDLKHKLISEEFTTSSGDLTSRCLLKPQYYTGFPFFYFLLPEGIKPVTLEVVYPGMQGKKQITFNINIKDGNFLEIYGPLFLEILFLIYVIGCLMRQRFGKKAGLTMTIYQKKREESTKTYKIKTNFISRYLIPFGKEKYELKNDRIKITAGLTPNIVWLRKEDQGVFKDPSKCQIYISGMPFRNDEFGKRDISIASGESIKYSQEDHTYEFYYLKDRSKKK